jgi:hypothetical protein
MSIESNKTNQPPGARVEAQPGQVIALRLRARNRMMAAGLLRPAVDDWVANDGQIFSAGARAEPAYLYLLQGAEARQTLTLRVPAAAVPGSVLRALLRFPGLGDEGVPIEVLVIPPAGTSAQAPIECPLDVALPLGDTAGASIDEGFGAAAQVSYSLVAGLAGLELIPARWLVAELLTAVCARGEERLATPEAQELLSRIGRTRFFKNGVIAFTSAQAPRWILSGLSASSGLHAALGGQSGQGQLVYIWERWLLSLADGDIESGESTPAVRVPDSTLNAYAAQLGGAADRWFGNLIIGLADLSPRIATALEAIAERSPPENRAPPPPGPAPDDVIDENGSLGR